MVQEEGIIAALLSFSYAYTPNNCSNYINLISSDSSESDGEDTVLQHAIQQSLVESRRYVYGKIVVRTQKANT